MIRSIFFFLSFFLFITHATAQDLQYARKVVDTLASATMYGRGYVVNDKTQEEAVGLISDIKVVGPNKECGVYNASRYISTEFRNLRLKRFETAENYLQPFTHPVNTFPEQMYISIDGNELSPGKDFLVLPYAKGIQAEIGIVWLTDSIINNKKKIKKFISFDYSNKAIIIDTLSENKSKKTFARVLLGQLKKPPQVIIYATEKKLTWGVSTEESNITEIIILKSAIRKNNKTILLNIKNVLIKNFSSQNIIGYIEGKEKPDSFIVFSAHYDHLGAMGRGTFFPGANDNASGISMLLNLVKYYSQNPPKYSIAFIAFAGEELGLLGSNFYVNSPLFPLSKIKFLINMDIIGTGDEGITVVNGSVYKNAFDLLSKINAEKEYLKQVKIRGKARNSDHYYFSEKGVPAFFIYTMGGISAYHDINDKSETLPLTEFSDLFKLLLAFADNL